MKTVRPRAKCIHKAIRLQGYRRQLYLTFSSPCLSVSHRHRRLRVAKVLRTHLRFSLFGLPSVSSGTPRLGSALSFLQHRCDGPSQSWKVALNNFPDRFQVDAEVVMDQEVSEGCDAPPLDFGFLRLQNDRQALC